jgi:hypothetical protein
MTIKDLYPTSRPSLDLNFARTKRLDPRVTFSRASTGTYFDANGVLQSAATNVARFDHNPSTGESLGLLVEEARTNLFRNSSDFTELESNPDHKWQKNEVYTIPNVAVAPDGTLTASKIVATTTTAVHRIRRVRQTVSPAWSSIYLKASEYTVCDIYDINIDTGFRIDLTTGVLSESPQFVGKFRSGRYGVDAIGNGWYRVRVGYSSSDSTNGNPLSIYPNGAQSFAGNGSSGVLVWGAQLETGSFPTSYIPTPATFTSRASTATYYDASGVIQTAGIDVARSAAYFPDSNGVMKPAGLLLEAAGTNLVTYSQEFDNAAWTKNASTTITANTVTAPDGTITADTMTVSSGLANTYQAVNPSLPAVFSVFVKQGTSTTVSIYDGNWPTSATFNFSTETISVSGTDITASFQKLSNGWYRIWYVKTSAWNNFAGIILEGTGATVHIWGAQLEASSYPTSYIPTTSSTVTRSADVSSSATVTRSADVAQITGTNFSSWYRQDEGTIYCKNLSYKNSGNPYGAYVISDNTASNRIFHAANLSGTASDLGIDSSGAQQVYFRPLSSASIGSLYATSFAYKVNDFAGSANGGATVTDTSGSVPLVNRLDLGFFYPGTASTNTLNGTISRLTYYPTRLSDTQLQALTAS